MSENDPYGSEGGARIDRPYPYSLARRSDLFLDLSSEFERSGYAIERLQRSAGSPNHNRAVAKHASGDALIHADAFDLVQKHFCRFLLDETDLQDDAPVRHRELRRRTVQSGHEDRNR